MKVKKETSSNKRPKLKENSKEPIKNTAKKRRKIIKNK